MQQWLKVKAINPTKLNLLELLQHLWLTCFKSTDNDFPKELPLLPLDFQQEGLGTHLNIILTTSLCSKLANRSVIICGSGNIIKNVFYLIYLPSYFIK